MNYTLLGSYLFLIGSLLFTVNSFIDLFQQISFYSISSVCGGILFTIGSILFILDAKNK
ncbi:MAG: hypothetical protein WBA07_12740 [Rivularia sp. (in: cyanobacteria)]